MLHLKQSLLPAHGLQLFLQSKSPNGRPNQLLLTRLRVQGIFESLKQNALAGVFITEDCLKLTPEMDRDVSLLASSPPNEVVLDVVQESECLLALLVSAGAKDSLKDVGCLLGRYKWHRRDHMGEVGQHRLLNARFIGQTDGDLDVTEDFNEGSGSRNLQVSE